MFVASNQSDEFVENLNYSERRQEIAKAAFDVVAEKGLEGLRVRDVAERVGINIATLHYHLPNKQVMIEIILQYAVLQIISTHDPSFSNPRTATEMLRQHFADHFYQFKHYPQHYLVIAEITLRSFRDESVRQMLKEQEIIWLDAIKQILQRGINEEDFDANLDIERVASHILVCCFAVCCYHAITKP